MIQTKNSYNIYFSSYSTGSLCKHLTVFCINNFLIQSKLQSQNTKRQHLINSQSKDNSRIFPCVPHSCVILVHTVHAVLYCTVHIVQYILQIVPEATSSDLKFWSVIIVDTVMCLHNKVISRAPGSNIAA